VQPLPPGGRGQLRDATTVFLAGGNKISGLSPQFPTKKFHNGSSWFIVTFLKNANMHYEYAVFMNLRENS
jgi:hypothetical protein